MLGIASALARLVRASSRRLGRGGGTTAPGRVLLRAEPRAISLLGSRLTETVLLSATNGKTTTASMLAAILERSGGRVVRNSAGSNMHWGVATALLDARRGGGQIGIFEVDEAWLPRVAGELEPSTMVLGNLFRDQLDRYGELEALAEGWAALVAERPGTRLVLNADDPLVADLGRSMPGATYFGLDDDAQALPGLQHAADSKHCRNCGAPYVYDAVWMGHLGRYRCDSCGRTRPQPDIVASHVELKGMNGSRFTLRAGERGSADVELPLPGLYNVYNALTAAAAALVLGASLDDVTGALSEIRAAFGRVERLRVGGRELAILLVKNPAGANEVLRTLALEDGEYDLWLALNDRIADGQDVSWIWDADFEVLAGRPGRIACSGTRAEEMALRLKYAGIEGPFAVERDLARSLDMALADGDGRPLYALPTYTALLELRDLLADRGVAAPWAG